MAVRSVCGRGLRHVWVKNWLFSQNLTLSRFSQCFSNTAAETNSTSKNEAKDESAGSAVDDRILLLEKEMKETRDKLTGEKEELMDKYKRSLAETENVRTRLKKEIADAKIFGIQGFCKDLLEVADILTKATESVPQSELKEGNLHLKNLYDGLMMTETQVQKVFTRHGLVKIDPDKGEKFDPYVHEALFQQPINGNEANTVAVVTKVGYKLHERTIRPALVGVFK